MTPEAAEALEKSIAHWEANVAAKTPDKASVHGSDCALCNLFCTSEMMDNDIHCWSCPVFKRTGRRSCEGTPYYYAHSAFNQWRYWSSHNIVPNEWRIAARRELEFLKSLRDSAP